MTKATVLNLPVLAGTMVAIGAAVAVAWFWHGEQVKDFAGDAIPRGQALERHARDVETQAKDLVARARCLEASADELEAKGQIAEATTQREEASSLYRQSQECLKDAAQNRDIASQYYLRYCELHPKDPDGPLALARIAKATGNLPAAVEWYATAIQIGRDGDTDWPSEHEVRVTHATLLLEWAQAYQYQAMRTDSAELLDGAIARFRRAETEARAVLNENAVDGALRAKAKRVYALAVFGLAAANLPHGGELASNARVEKVLDEAFEVNAADADLALALARICRAANSAHADEVLQRLVDTAEANWKVKQDDKAKQDATDAHLARFRYRRHYNLADAEADLQRALELTPDSPAAHLLAGWNAIREAESQSVESPGGVLARRQKLQQARRHFLIARNFRPANQAIYLGLAEADRKLGNVEDALQTYRMGLEQVGASNLELNYALLDLLLDARLLTETEARKRFDGIDAGIARQRTFLSDSALRLRESRRDHLRARWLAQQEDYDQAIQLLDQLLVKHGLARDANDSASLINREELRAWLLIANCHGRWATRLNKEDDTRAAAKEHFRLAAEVYQRLVAELPHVNRFRRLAGEMFLSAGESGQAVTQFKHAIEIEDRIDLRLLLVRAQLDQLQKMKPAVRAYDDVEQQLDLLEKRLREERVRELWTVSLLRVELASLQGDGNDGDVARETALATYRQLEIDYPNSDALRTTLLGRYQQLQASDDLPRVTASREIVRALADNYSQEAVKALGELEQVIGRDSLLWRYYRLYCLVVEMEKEPALRSKRLAEAKRTCAEIVASRPEWMPGHVAAANLARVQGDLVAAERSLRKALDLCPSDFHVLSQLVRLQLRLGHVSDAKSVVAAAREQFSHSDQVVPLESLVLAAAGDPQAAIGIVREEICSHPDDPRPRVRLGELLAQTGRHDEAVSVLEEAALIAPGKPESLMALLKIHGDAGRVAEAAAVLERLVDNEHLSRGEKALVLVRGYTAIGEIEKAQRERNAAIQAGRAAIEQEPRNLQLRLELAKLVLSDDVPERFDDAEKELMRALAIAPNSTEAKRMLAEVLWTRNIQDDRQRAIRIYEDLAENATGGSAEDQYRLGTLHERLGDFAAAEKIFDSVVDSALLSEGELSRQIQRCLHREQLEKAERLLERLERMAPWKTQTVQLRIQLLYQQDRAQEIVSVLDKWRQQLETFAGNVPARLSSMNRFLGDAYSSVKMFARAEPYYRKLVEYSPAGLVPLAACLASQDRSDEAITLVLRSRKTTDIVICARALANIATGRTLRQADWERIEPVFEKTLAERGDQVELLLLIAGVYVGRGNIDNGVELLEQAVSTAPNNIGALNNLAALLVEKQQRADEALRYIDRALRLANYAPQLLDTKGTILLRLGRCEEAVTLLRQAIKGPDPDPRIVFHLSVACDRVGDELLARENLRKAFEQGLLRSTLVLTSVDRSWLADLKQKYSM